MPLSPGVRLGAYEILSKLGEGGMGEVYRARDTRLKRDVAIKVLPDSFARDPDRLARFQREAELLATLNHPNIAGIYGFEEASSVSGIVLELVDGATLADRIAHGAIPVDEAISFARQIADALEAAHDKGIVHRDLKPSNIKLTPGGQVKVLDFGLAKAMESIAASSAAGLSISPTMVSPATRIGIIVGTAAYMSPEQARGKSVDQRADIWAFGCVLFEMLTGRPPFEPGDTVSDAIAAILTREPDWNALPAMTPPSVRRLLRRCLDKDPNRRVHHIADARLELEEDGILPAVDIRQPVARSRWRILLPWGIAALSVGIAASALLRPRPNGVVPTQHVTRLELNLPNDLELYNAAGTLGLSPDGSRVAFVGVLSGARQVYVRRFDQFDVVPVRGTDNASACFFSADGSSIGFITASGVLKTVSLGDGVVMTAADGVSTTSGAAWSADGGIIFERGSTLWRVPASGGAPRPVTTLDIARRETRHMWPFVLPNARTLVFSVVASDGLRVDALDLTTGARHVVVESGTMPMYTTAGQLVFVRDGRVFAAPFDAAAARITGPATQVLDDVPQLATGVPGLLAVSLSGTVVYSPTNAVSHLVFVSRNGEEQILNDDRRRYANPRLSADGQRIVVQAGDLWMQDLARGTFSRLTNGDAVNNAFPIWISDSRLMYRSMNGLRVQGTNGPGDGVATIPGTTQFDYPGAVSPDGDTLVFLRSTDVSAFDIHTLSLRDPSKTSTILQTPAYEGGARLSPDGRWLTYVSNETGRNEIYIAAFPGLGQRLQVSTQGGTQAVWNPNGREIFYRIDDKMMAVAVESIPALKLSAPRVLFEGRYAYGVGVTIPNFDVSHDGQRFIMVKPETGAGRLNVVLNWFADRERPAASN